MKLKKNMIPQHKFSVNYFVDKYIIKLESTVTKVINSTYSLIDCFTACRYCTEDESSG